MEVTFSTVLFTDFHMSFIDIQSVDYQYIKL